MGFFFFFLFLTLFYSLTLHTVHCALKWVRSLKIFLHFDWLLVLLLHWQFFLFTEIYSTWRYTVSILATATFMMSLYCPLMSWNTNDLIVKLPFFFFLLRLCSCTIGLHLCFYFTVLMNIYAKLHHCHVSYN